MICFRGLSGPFNGPRDFYDLEHARLEEYRLNFEHLAAQIEPNPDFEPRDFEARTRELGLNSDFTGTLPNPTVNLSAVCSKKATRRIQDMLLPRMGDLDLMKQSIWMRGLGPGSIPNLDPLQQIVGSQQVALIKFACFLELEEPFCVSDCVPLPDLPSGATPGYPPGVWLLKPGYREAFVTTQAANPEVTKPRGESGHSVLVSKAWGLVSQSRVFFRCPDRPRSASNPLLPGASIP